MNTSLFDVPVTAVVAACLACALNCSATSDVIQMGSINHPLASNPVDHQGSGPMMPGARDGPPNTRGLFNSRIGQDGLEAHFQVQTTASARFELRMDLTVDVPRYREPIDALDPGEGPYALDGSGMLRIASTADAFLAGGTVRIRNTDTQQEMIFLLAHDEDLLEVALDPGTYDILIEGFIADEAKTEDVNRRLAMHPAPAGTFALAAIFSTFRRRRG
jgi:hypothetical protein